MSKKDFELIAKIISSLSNQAKVEATTAFTKRLAKEYPRFDTAKFVVACLKPRPYREVKVAQ